jgi:murein DD-endopeptidase MepM/ murein hydrolase activator NlpD
MTTAERTMQMKEQILSLFREIPGFFTDKINNHKLITISFLVVALLLPPFLLFHQHRISNQLYVVYMDDLELGIVEEERDVELFLADLVERCSSLYGMPLELTADIYLKKQYRPDKDPDPESVQKIIRQRATFVTDAYMITIDDEPIVPVAATDILDEALLNLKEIYLEKNDEEVKVIEVFIEEDFSVTRQAVSPEKLYNKDEVVSLLLDSIDNNQGDMIEEELIAATTEESHTRGLLNSRYLADRSYLAAMEPVANNDYNSQSNSQLIDEVKVKVTTVEEMRVVETIPFTTEFIDDNRMYVNESTIETPGVDGEKEVLYQITRENGIEVERIVIEETILAEPVEQVELIGQKKLPSPTGGGGGGKFIWPVQGEGIIYPNQGFRPGHNGVDIHIDHGTNVLAAESGIVWFSGFGGSQGNYIILRHSGYWTLYLHNSENLVRKGDRVSKGQVIARVGATGRAYGPHLHFEVRVDDGTGEWHSYYQHQPVDPMNYIGRKFR